jgi:FADH2 O2-dependent halogenase
VSADFDLAVVGSGFAGSLLAAIAARAGRSVVLVEEGSHPRFVIGESTSPLANLLLEELAGRYGLPGPAALAKWGSWRRSLPGTLGGVKRGFSFLHHRAGEPFRANRAASNPLLVAASPREDIADTHWYRADVDRVFLEAARGAGVAYVDRTRLAGASFSAAGARLSGEGPGGPVELTVRFVVDASGARGFLHRALGLPEASFPGLPETRALYSHFGGVRRLEEMDLLPGEDSPPYPIDDAAVHHLFGGGWIWVLRFSDGVASAGAALTAPLAREIGGPEGAAAWARLLSRFPTIREQFRDSRALRPYGWIPRLAFRTGRAAGPGWAMLPSAAAFVDPLLSTGFPLTLLGVERLARAIEEEWGGPRFPERVAAHGAKTLFEADTAAALISALYASLEDPELFAGLSLLYFAAATYAEAARRLGRPERSGSFLSGDHPGYGPALARISTRAVRLGAAKDRPEAQRRGILAEIARAIEPFDVAGLSDPARRGFYPVVAEDLLANSGKLGATRREAEAMLSRCGFFRG